MIVVISLDLYEGVMMMVDMIGEATPHLDDDVDNYDYCYYW